MSTRWTDETRIRELEKQLAEAKRQLTGLRERLGDAMIAWELEAEEAEQLYPRSPCSPPRMAARNLRARIEFVRAALEAKP
jgi:hypothetical protein